MEANRAHGRRVTAVFDDGDRAELVLSKDWRMQEAVFGCFLSYVHVGDAWRECLARHDSK